MQEADTDEEKLEAATLPMEPDSSPVTSFTVPTPPSLEKEIDSGRSSKTLQFGQDVEQQPLSSMLATISPQLLDEKITNDIHLAEIARSLTNWKAVISFLGFSELEEETIEEDYRTQSAKRLAVLRKWREKCGPVATYRNLAKYFYEANKIEMVEAVCKVLQPSATPLQPNIQQQPSTAIVLRVDDLGVLKRLLLPVAAYWVPIADQLGMASQVIYVRCNPDNNSPPAFVRDLLFRWLQRGYPTPTLEELCRALRCDDEIIGGHQVANKLEETFQGREAASTCLTLKNVVNEMRGIADDEWFSLGIQLGVSPHKLHEVEMLYHGSHERSKIEVLSWWFQSTPSWEKLADAVHMMGYGALAQRLRKKYQEVSDTSSNDTAAGKPASQFDKPTLVECMRFPGRNGRINIPLKIGLYYVMFGVLLLDDHSGTKIQIFAHKHNSDAELINMDILQEWIDGRGRRPVTWATLTEVLRECGLSELASDIEASKGQSATSDHTSEVL